MNLKKVTLLFILLTCLTYTTLAQTNYELQGSDVTIDDDGIITACSYNFGANGTNLTIPKSVTKDSEIIIKGIDSKSTIGVFQGKNLVSVKFASVSEITSIGYGTFRDNDLTSVDLPVSLTTIENHAFNKNEITKLTFPEDTQLTTIGSSAFERNQMTELSLPTILTTIAGYAFAYNPITKLTFPENSQLTTIGNGAFISNHIKELSLPPSLTTIGKKAFKLNSLTYVAFNNTNKSQIKSIGSEAFSGNTMQLNDDGITLPKHAEGDGVTYKDSDDQEYNQEDSFTNFNISLAAVFPAHTLTADDVEVENGIITKCTCNFLSNSIKIPEKIDGETITGIADKASPDGVFQDKSLVAVAFAAESKITSIGSHAFSKNQIATLTLPTTVTTIGESAFQGQKNNSLTSVTFAGDQNNKSMIRSIGINAFSSNTGLMSITLPYNGNNNFGGYRDSNGVGHSEGATITNFTLGYNAFISYTLTAEDIDVSGVGIITKCNCDKFTSRDISIPASITKDGNAVNIVGIGTLVFSNKQLTSVVLPEGLISIGVLAFGYNSLAPLTLPSSVKYIGSQAFYGNNLTAVTFAGDGNNKANIISIGHEAFANNTDLTPINLPSHTLATDDDFRYKDGAGTEYAQGAKFKDFDRSLYADIPHTLTADDIEVDATNGVITKCNCNNFDSRTITIPTAITTPNGQLTITEIGNNVFQNETLATVSFAIGSQITAIGRFAFNSNSIGTLTLPTTLTTIGEGAFLYNSITTLTLPPSLTIIGISAFKYNSITKLTLPTTLTTIGASAFQNNPLPSFILPSVTIEGYRTYWQDGDSKNLIADPTIRNTDFTKSFELVSIEQFTLTVEVNNEAGGSIEPSDDHFVVDKTATPSTQVLTAKPNTGWRFDKWVITSGEDGNGNPITETFDVVGVDVKVDADKTATAYFVEQVTLTLAIHGVGQVQGLEAGENPIDKGQEFTITATPNEGHEFEKWVFEGANISTSTYTIPADKTQDNLSIEVHFEKKPFNDPVELTISIDGQGTVTPNTGINTYERGSGVDLTATPQDGWKFDKWVITSGEDGNGNPITETVDDVDHVVTVDADKTATAHFVEAVILTLTIEETEASGVVSGLNAGKNKIDKGADFELKATPASGQRFVSWTIGVETIVTEEYTLPATDTEDDISITVTFEAIPQQVTLTLAIEGEGSINPSVEPNSVDPDNEMKGMYDIDTEVTLEATPNDGWRFDKWVIGTDESTDNPTDGISMDTDKTATAHFVKEEEAITSILTEVVSANPYPNPVTSQITLKAKDGDLIQLFSQKGKQQYSTQHTGNEVHIIDVSTIPVGVYLVRITDAEGNTTTKRILKK